MASPLVIQSVFTALQGLQVIFASIFGFPVIRGHRILISIIAVVQALRHLPALEVDRIAWLQLAGSILGSATLFALVENVAARLNPTSSEEDTGRSTAPASQIQSANTYGPWLLPCKTSHTRQFPKKHVFAYSYLQVAFQVGTAGAYGGSILGIEGQPQFGDSSTWFSISAVDHLFRGPSADGTLLGKLRNYLKTEGVAIEDVPYVFLVTAPRFLGYSFNPVSFWYLYDQQKSLRYMLLEVNNTFDERRMYLLDRQDADTAFDEDLKTPIFRKTWPKDFHVSPFNSRKGSYSLLTHDPGFMSADITKQTCPQIDNTITLRSSKSHAKLVARLFSTGPALSANSLTFVEKIAFIASWFWVGFFTFPRILKEAAKLFFARGLHVWFRPEVFRSSIGRQATWREELIGEHFGQFLRQLCKSDRGKQAALAPIIYTHALAVPGPRTQRLGGVNKPAVQFQVLSPMFYAQYAVDMHILSRDIPSEGQLASIQESTKAKSNGQNLSSTSATLARSHITEVISEDPSDTTALSKSLGVPLRWFVLRLLRRWRKSRNDKVASKVSGKLMNTWSHPLDNYVYSTCVETTDPDTLRKGEEYRMAVTGLLLAETFAFGSAELLDAAAWLYTASIMWLALSLSEQAWAAKELSSISALAAFTTTASLIYR